MNEETTKKEKALKGDPWKSYKDCWEQTMQ